MPELKRFDVTWMREQIDKACAEFTERLKYEAERLKRDVEDVKIHCATASNAAEAIAIWVRTFTAQPDHSGRPLAAYGTVEVMNGYLWPPGHSGGSNCLPLGNGRSEASELKPGHRYKAVLSLYDLGPAETEK